MIDYELLECPHLTEQDSLALVPTLPAELIDLICSLIDADSLRTMSLVSRRTLGQSRTRLLSQIVLQTSTRDYLSELLDLLDILHCDNFIGPYVTSIQLKDDKLVTYLDALEPLFRNLPNLRAVSFEGISFVNMNDPDAFVRAFSRCPIERLCLKTCGLGAQMFFSMLGSIPVIQHLSLENLHIPEFENADGEPESDQEKLAHFRDTVRLVEQQIALISTSELERILATIQSVVAPLDVVRSSVIRVFELTHFLVPREYPFIDFDTPVQSYGLTIPRNPVIHTLSLQIVSESDHALMDLFGSSSYSPTDIHTLKVSHTSKFSTLTPTIVNGIKRVVNATAKSLDTISIGETRPCKLKFPPFCTVSDCLRSVPRVLPMSLPIGNVERAHFHITVKNWKPSGTSEWLAMHLERLPETAKLKNLFLELHFSGNGDLALADDGDWDQLTKALTSLRTRLRLFLVPHTEEIGIREVDVMQFLERLNVVLGADAHHVSV